MQYVTIPSPLPVLLHYPHGDQWLCHILSQARPTPAHHQDSGLGLPLAWCDLPPVRTLLQAILLGQLPVENVLGLVWNCNPSAGENTLCLGSDCNSSPGENTLYLGWDCNSSPGMNTIYLGWYCNPSPGENALCLGWNCNLSTGENTQCLGWDCNRSLPVSDLPSSCSPLQ